MPATHNRSANISFLSLLPSLSLQESHLKKLRALFSKFDIQPPVCNAACCKREGYAVKSATALDTVAAGRGVCGVEGEDFTDTTSSDATTT